MLFISKQLLNAQLIHLHSAEIQKKNKIKKKIA